MRVLVVSDAGAPTGFGTVTHNIFERIVEKHGWDVHVLAANYRGDHVDTNLKLYVPTMNEPKDIYGMSRFLELAGKIGPEVIFFLNDPQIVLNFLLNNRWDNDRVLWRGISNGETTYKPPIIAYLPIDGYNSPKSWDILKDRCRRVAMSHFGQEAMPEAPVVWHGVDTSVFKPMNKTEAKRQLGFDPDRFLVLRVDKNSFRKNYPDTWRALRPVMRRHPDIDVQFHCLPATVDGNNLHSFAFNDEDIRERLTFSPNLTGWTGWTTESLVTLYNAADVFVSTSWGEGFGLTILEAMACGVPVVAQDCSAVTEVVGDGGILIKPQRPFAAPMGQDQMLPDVDGFSEAIERIYLSKGLRRDLSAKAVEQASKMSWDIAADRMMSVIEDEVTLEAARAKIVVAR